MYVNFVLLQKQSSTEHVNLGKPQDENGCMLPAHPNVQIEAARLK
jgi:hypothetical protein